MPRLLQAIEKLNEVVHVSPPTKNEHSRIVQLLEAINYVLGMAQALRARNKETKV